MSTPPKAGRGPATLACIFLVGVVCTATQAQTLTTLHSFQAVKTDGASPQAALVQGSDGNFYGATIGGGANGTGAIFKITPAGTFTLLRSLAADTTGTNTSGAFPNGLIQGSDGNLYGTSQAGGAHGTGVVFQISPSGTMTTLHSFAALSSGTNTEGAVPYAALVQAGDGNFYGTCSEGGTNGTGTVFKIAASGTFTTLYAFSSDGAGTNADGSHPLSALIQGSDGAFYGATFHAGANGTGTIFKITSGGTLTTLYAFSAFSKTYTNSDGANPYAGLVQGNDGNFYGTTYDGGANQEGTVFQLTPGGTLTVLHTFTAISGTGTNSDGAFANGLIQASDGAFYGTTFNGGANGTGTIFKLTSGGTLTTLYAFTARSGTGTNTDGADPYAALTQGSDGKFYGTCSSGGASVVGTVFCLDIGGKGGPVLSSLSPSSTRAGGPAFTLIVKGSAFAATSIVNWNSSPLTTTYVSATQLKAAVPAALIASAGKVPVNVVTPGGGSSHSKSFTIVQTTLKLLSATLTRDSATGVITATVTLKNTGYLSAAGVAIKNSTLGTAGTTSSLPVSVGSIGAGASGSASLAYPGSAGAKGTRAVLKVSGVFTGGTFSGSLKVTLP